MNNFFPHLSTILPPLIVSNVFHMLVVKKNYFSFLKIPLSEKLFGANKTYRGFVLLTICNGLTEYMFSLFTTIAVHPPFLYGAVFGFVYALSELPNSWLKRRLGISSGSVPEKNGYLFSLLDKSDSAFGVCLVYYLLSAISLNQAIFLFIFCSGTHALLSFLLLKFKLKSAF